MVTLLFMSSPKALTNLPAGLGVPTPVSSTHQARGRGWVRVVMSQRPLKSESAASEGMAERRRTPNRVRSVMANLMYHERESSTQRRGDAEENAEKTNRILMCSLRLSQRLCVSALNGHLPQFHRPHDDSALAAVGGIGREGAIEFELHQHFGAGRGDLRAFQIAGPGDGVSGDDNTGGARGKGDRQ